MLYVYIYVLLLAANKKSVSQMTISLGYIMNKFGRFRQKIKSVQRFNMYPDRFHNQISEHA